MGGAVEQIRLALISIPGTNLLEALHHPHQLCGAVDHRHVNHLTLTRLRGLQKPSHHAGHQQHAAATEVPHQIQRHDRSVAATPDGMQCAGNGNVIQVVARGLRKRARLPPTRHARKNELGIARETFIGPKAQLFADTWTVWID